MKNKSTCSMCNACLNICPKGAITRKEDIYGFLFPVIDEEKCIRCGLCDEVCAKIGELNKNYPQNTIAVSSRNVDLSKDSSSGGVFAELARYVLSQNGIVFGSALEKVDYKFVIKHISVDNEKDLYKLQGSKYVQSDIGSTFKEAKKLLEEGKKVLYSGTPCQIAGLKTFLHKDYENLLTVDLSCTGVPNQRLLNDYVAFLEKKHNIMISDFKFRDKSINGWACNGYSFSGINGKIYKENGVFSAYHTLFLNNLITRKSCTTCHFSGLNRISDITIADCWGIEQVYPSLLKENGGIFDKNNGISLVLINSKRGAECFRVIEDNVIFKEVNIEKLKQFNGPLRERNIMNDTMEYLEAYKQGGYTELDRLFRKKQGLKYYYNKILPYIPRCLKSLYKYIFKKQNADSTDCILLTWYYLKNYGAILTAYALKKAINNLGYSAKLLKFCPTKNILAVNFNNKYQEFTKMCLNSKDLSNLSKHSNTFIVGSDNQLNFSINGDFTYNNLLFWLPQNVKKAIISGSLGKEYNINENQKHILSTLYKRFDYVSVREYSGVDILKTLDCSAEWGIDPVFMLSQEEYENIAANAKVNAREKIMSYILYPSKTSAKIIEKIEKDEKSEIIEFTGNEQSVKALKNKNITVEDWLKTIIDAKLIISDSYHCICFAILFNKPFVCLKNNNGFFRFESLFKMFNLKNVVTESEDNIVYNDFADNLTIKNVIKDRTKYINQKIIELMTKDKVLTEKQIQAEKDLMAISKKLLTKPYWYRENKLFFYLVIVPFVKPFKHLLRTLRHEND